MTFEIKKVLKIETFHRNLTIETFEKERFDTKIIKTIYFQLKNLEDTFCLDVFCFEDKWIPLKVKHIITIETNDYTCPYCQFKIKKPTRIDRTSIHPVICYYFKDNLNELFHKILHSKDMRLRFIFEFRIITKE